MSFGLDFSLSFLNERIILSFVSGQIWYPFCIFQLRCCLITLHISKSNPLWNELQILTSVYNYFSMKIIIFTWQNMEWVEILSHKSLDRSEHWVEWLRSLLPTSECSVKVSNWKQAVMGQVTRLVLATRDLDWVLDFLLWHLPSPAMDTVGAWEVNQLKQALLLCFTDYWIQKEKAR